MQCASRTCAPCLIPDLLFILSTFSSATGALPWTPDYLSGTYISISPLPALSLFLGLWARSPLPALGWALVLNRVDHRTCHIGCQFPLLPATEDRQETQRNQVWESGLQSKKASIMKLNLETNSKLFLVFCVNVLLYRILKFLCFCLHLVTYDAENSVEIFHMSSNFMSAFCYTG